MLQQLCHCVGWTHERWQAVGRGSTSRAHSVLPHECMCVSVYTAIVCGDNDYNIVVRVCAINADSGGGVSAAVSETGGPEDAHHVCYHSKSVKSSSLTYNTAKQNRTHAGIFL